MRLYYSYSPLRIPRFAMNIFFLSLNPHICATFYVDRHVVKIILEIAQMLCAAHHEHPVDDYTPPYKSTHLNHPMTRWIRESLQNYVWAVKHGLALCREYTRRYKKVHGCQETLSDLYEYTPDIPSHGFITPPQCMPDHCKSRSVVEAYRRYYNTEKRHLFHLKSGKHCWKTREIPDWIEGSLQI